MASTNKYITQYFVIESRNQELILHFIMGFNFNVFKFILSLCFCVGKEFCKKVEVYYCELCKFNLPPHEDVEQQLSLHCRNRVHLQRYVQHCEKTKSEEKITESVVSTQNIEETKSDSDSSNKV